MEEGMPIMEAAIEAARLRFRPIVMTSMAFVFGIVPLVGREQVQVLQRDNLWVQVYLVA
jgi:multidrug efflux pump subunit AcrB